MIVIAKIKTRQEILIVVVMTYILSMIKIMKKKKISGEKKKRFKFEFKE